MTPEEKKEKKKPLSKSDQDMIDELDYEYKKAHKPYDKYERHWDEAQAVNLPFFLLFE